MNSENSFELELQKSLKKIDRNQIVQGHILKFVPKGKHHVDKGIVCFPENTYGHSQQSPEHFQGKHALIPKNSYFYRHENKPEFRYFSQKRYLSVDGSTNQQQSKLIHFEDSQNRVKFHRKKGRLSEFMDKNGWMSKTTKIMGHERDDKARQFSNRDRNRRILQLKPKVNYENEILKKPNTAAQYFRTLGALTSQKLKFRAKRNQEAEKFSSSLRKRQISTSHRASSVIDKQIVQNRMLESATEWSPSKITREKYEEFSKTAQTSRFLRFERERKQRINFRQHSMRENKQETLEDWHQTTCNSKWVYQKKLETEDDQL